MNTQRLRAVPRRPKQLLFATAVVASLLTMSACSGSSTSGDSTAGSSSPYGFTTAKQDSTAAITVWVDASRQPAVDAFKKANPDVAIKVETYDGGANGSGTFQTKIEADNQAGNGWPDVVFSTQNNDASWASQGSDPFAAPLDKGYFDKTFLSGFTTGALAPLTVDGTVYGLRNDLASTVTWYDKALMDQFGYTPPTTWEEYEQLGKKVATEHPGYIVGDVGDPWTPEVYFWGGKAPMNTVKGVDQFSANAADPKTVNMAKIIDSLIGAGSMAQDSVFSPEFLQKYTGKVLMLPGPVWYSGALFQNKDSLNAAPGTITAGLPLAWKGSDPAGGNVGGGTWFASRHSTNLEAVKKFMTFVTSDPSYQVDLAPGLPAYTAAADKWLAKQSESNFFTPDFVDNVSKASTLTWDGWGYPSFSQEGVWAKTITPDLAGGKSLVDMLPAWQKALENEAQANGYKVS